MTADDMRFLFDYDRWASRRLFSAMEGVDPQVWSRTNVVDERGLGGIMLHTLGALMRWRHRLSRAEGELPRPERAPLPEPSGLIAMFEEEWARYDDWQRSWTDEMMAYPVEGTPIWQLLAHVVNHGTQHRSEAAALLTAEGLSPGDLDLVVYTDELAGNEP